MIDNDKANASIQKTEGLAGKLGAGLGKGIGIAAKWGAALTVAAAAAAIAIGGTALKAAVSFEKQMANVATLLDGDVKSKIGNLGGAVKKLSSDTGTSVDLLTDGLYQVISAFGETDDAMKILEIATKGAAAGNATVTDSVNLLSAVTKGYGDTSSKAAQQTSDLAFLTVKLGQTTFPELASSMGKVIPLAGSLAVKQTDLFGAMATLTGVTGNTAEVSTQLRGVMQGLLKPSTSMTSALEEMGFQSGGAAIESLGLQGVLDGLKGTVNGNDTALLSMFGSVEAGGAVLALTGAQADNFTSKTKAMADAQGATEAAFKTQQETVSAMMAKMKASFEVVMITLGEKVLPVFNDFLEWILLNMPQIKETMEIVFNKISELVNISIAVFRDHLLPIFQSVYDWVQVNFPAIKETIKTAFSKMGDVIKVIVDKVKDLIDWFQKYEDILVPVVAGIVAATTAFGIYSAAVAIVAKVHTLAATATTAFATAVAFLTSPIGIVVIAIGALIAIGVLLYKNWDKISAFAKEAFDKVKQAAIDLKDKVKGAFTEIWEGISGGFVKLAKDALQWGEDMVEGLWNGILGQSDWLLGKIGEWADSVASAFKNFFGISSPSKLMSAYGKYIDEGLAEGIINNADKPISSMKFVADNVVEMLEKVSSFVTGTISIIEKQFELWALKNNVVAESSQYLQKQLEMQKEKHILLNDQILATSNALDSAILEYGEGSTEALNYKNALLGLQIQQENLTDSIEKSNDALNKQRKLTTHEKSNRASSLNDLLKKGIITSESLKKSGTNILDLIDGSHANGLAKVPYDGYIMETHKNEEVLRADDPRNQNNGGRTLPRKNNITVNINGANVMDDYGVDRLMDRVMDRMAVLGVR